MGVQGKCNASCRHRGAASQLRPPFSIYQNQGKTAVLPVLPTTASLTGTYYVTQVKIGFALSYIFEQYIEKWSKAKECAKAPLKCSHHN